MGFAIGENVGPYRIIAQLGSGGMATVYKAYHAALDRYVAIKVMLAAFKEAPNFLARFQREARIVARLEHPHIVPVYDFNEHEGQPYLVMRFIEGDTLKAHLQAEPMTIAQVIDIVRPVCRALAYAHDQGVLHRDIKPSNILLTAQGGVFLTDFGLAKITQAGESTLSQDTLIGTPQYISPEQAQGSASLDARTDISSATFAQAVPAVSASASAAHIAPTIRAALLVICAVVATANFAPAQQHLCQARSCEIKARWTRRWPNIRRLREPTTGCRVPMPSQARC